MTQFGTSQCCAARTGTVRPCEVFTFLRVPTTGGFKSWGRDAGHLREFIRSLKCIKDGGKTGVEHAV